ncbi:MAG: pyridoxal phosphate-dependent aminotransferase [Planctomycetota bacterium]|nr:pyridoxal phosphate-dependent aminotransferase [Planctomycetota bacterium]
MKVATRLQEIRPSATLVMAARAAALRREGKPIISFTTGEPDFDTPEHIKDAAAKAMREGFTKYTAAGGILELREAVRDRIQRDYGLQYGTDQIIITCGAKHAISNALMALCNAGDEVICISPYWTSYPEMIRLAGGTPVLVKTRAEDGYIPSAADLEAAFTERTRVLILNSPSNPTGAVYTEDKIKEIAEAIRGRDIAVITDDIYDRLIYGGHRFASITAAGEEVRENTIIVGGVSKTYAMTGWRIGYAAGPRPIIQGMETLQSQTTSNPTSISQKAALAALRGPDDACDAMRTEFDRRRKAMLAGLRQISGIQVTEPFGAFFTFPRVASFFGRKVKGKELRSSIDIGEALLEEAHVAIVPGAAFGDDRAIRLSYALSFEAITEGMARIAKFFEETLE